MKFQVISLILFINVVAAVSAAPSNKQSEQYKNSVENVADYDCDNLSNNSDVLYQNLCHYGDADTSDTINDSSKDTDTNTDPNSDNSDNYTTVNSLTDSSNDSNDTDEETIKCSKDKCYYDRKLSASSSDSSSYEVLKEKPKHIHRHHHRYGYSNACNHCAHYGRRRSKNKCRIKCNTHKKLYKNSSTSSDSSSLSSDSTASESYRITKKRKNNKFISDNYSSSNSDKSNSRRCSIYRLKRKKGRKYKRRRGYGVVCSYKKETSESNDDSNSNDSLSNSSKSNSSDSTSNSSSNSRSDRSLSNSRDADSNGNRSSYEKKFQKFSTRCFYHRRRRNRCSSHHRRHGNRRYNGVCVYQQSYPCKPEVNTIKSSVTTTEKPKTIIKISTPAPLSTTTKSNFADVPVNTESHGKNSDPKQPCIPRNAIIRENTRYEYHNGEDSQFQLNLCSD